MRAVVMLAFCSMIVLFPARGMANEEGAAAGAVTGAVAGAAVGGPIGAVIGAVVGGAVGNAASDAAATEGAAPVPSQSGEPTLGRAERPVAPPAGATGTVVQQRTCVREADGTATCRIVR